MTCTCVACQCGLALACTATEARIRADERARLRHRITVGVDGGELLELARSLTDLRRRRRAQLLVHTLLAVLDGTETKNEAA